jgi:pilus assembly protein CpaE
MLAGARDFLTKPFGGDELIAAVRRVYNKRPNIPVAPVGGRQGGNVGTATAGPTTKDGQIIAVFSPKGGSGCTTIAINIAVALAKRSHQTLLIDGSLQFGDVAVMLNLKQMTSIIDLIERGNELDADLIKSVVQLHNSGLSVLLSPPRPEMADVVVEAKLRNLLDVLRDLYDFIIIDTSSYLSEVALTVLDKADRIILTTQQSLPSLKNASRFFDLTESLEYPSDKVWLVVNRASTKQGISVKDISNALKRPVTMVIPGDDLAVSTAADQGIPVITNANKQPISIALNNLAEHIVQELSAVSEKAQDGESGKDSGLLGRLFGGRAKAGG